MSKELSPLEIINIKLKDKNNKYDRRVVNCNDEYLYLIKEEELDIIETALNDNRFYLYIIDKVCKYLSIDFSSCRDLVETENKILNTLAENEKKLKAFEIIKEKSVNVSLFLNLRILKMYNDWVDDKTRKLAEEEYDLLKEVLL